MRHAPRTATAVFFFLQGLCAASFIARIPELKAHLALTDTQLGLATGLMACGGLVMLPLAGLAVSRFGSKRVLCLGAMCHLLFLAGVGQSEGWAGLLVLLVCFGMANTAVQISVNAQAVLAERALGRSMLAQFHGLWSVAGFVGALLGTAAVASGVQRSWHFAGIAALGLAGVAVFAPRLAQTPHSGTRLATDAPKHWLRAEAHLVRLALLTFGAMFCESAMFDWSGVYFSQNITPDPLWVGLSYSVFMAAMAGGRFVADRFVGSLGIERVLPLSGQLVAAGYLLCAALPYRWFALLGFALTGFGVCAMVPLIMGQAGRASRTPLGVALAFVSTVGFVGAFLGPLLVGLVAEHAHLRVAFTGVGFVGLGISLCAKRVIEKAPVSAAASQFASAH